MKRGFEHAVPFVSQREHGPRRWREAGCGIASLMMLLKHRSASSKKSVSVPSYQKLLVALEAINKKWRDGREDEYGLGIYKRDIIPWLRKSKISHKAPGTWTQVIRALDNAPVMIGLLKEDHWIVLVAADRVSLTYLDPYRLTDKRHKIRKRRAVVRPNWDGRAIALLP